MWAFTRNRGYLGRNISHAGTTMPEERALSIDYGEWRRFRGVSPTAILILEKKIGTDAWHIRRLLPGTW